MSVSRRGFLSSLLGLAAASLSPIGLLFDRRPGWEVQPYAPTVTDGLCGYWRLGGWAGLTPEQLGGLTLKQWAYLCSDGRD